MNLAVIGAGFGRTGTESMKAALEMLGFGPCYHMLEVIPDKDRVDTWRRATMGDLPDWDQVFADYQATVDWPAAYYWRHLAAHYPSAKILLTVRDGDSWYRSMENTILRILRQRDDTNSLASRLLTDNVFAGNIDDRDHIIAVYEKNTADVQAAFDKDRLLTYRLGDGWQPLCDFLGCEVPAETYPHKNKPEDFEKSVKRARAMQTQDNGLPADKV